MRPQPRQSAFFQLSRCAAWSLALIAPLSSASWAQSTTPSQLNFGRWQCVAPTTGSAVVRGQSPSDTAISEVRQANFQAPDNSQLPQLPGMTPAPLPDLGSSMPNLVMPPAAGALSDSPVLPPPTVPGGFNQFSNPGGAMAPTQVQPAGGSGLRDINPAQLPPLNNNAQSGNYSQPGNNTQPGYRPAVYQNGAPTGNSNQFNGQFNGQVNPNAYNQGQVLPPGSLRNATQQPTMPGPNGQLAVVSQDPRFISPAVRTGNYATVPYRAPLRTISYQTGSQGMVSQGNGQVLPPQVKPPLTVASQPQPQALVNNSALPQFQPTVGAQLTSYQSGYQAGQYCQPGVPQYVPGAVVPPTLTPNLAPQMYSPDNAGFKPLFSLGQENYNVLLGRGIIGQPTAYVPGQPVRNFMRYIFP